MNRSQTSSRRRGRLAAALVAVAVLVAACGEDDDGAENTTSIPTSSSPPLVPIGVAESGSDIELVPPQVFGPGVVEIELTNTGNERHTAQIVRIEGVHTEKQVIDAYGDAQRGKPVPDWFFAAGGVGPTEPDTSRSVVQELGPGNYWILDDEGTRKPNYLAGGAAPFTVGGQPDEVAQLPGSSATVTASEYALESEGLKAGESEIRFANAGAEPHHVIAAPLLPGKTIEDVAESLEGGGPQPVDFDREAASAVIEGGDEQVLEVELERGRYALLCFIADREGGPPHAFEGMIGEAVVE
jgi:hypothetical protein